MQNFQLQYPLVLHIPHASTEMPPDLRDTFLLSEQELQVEINRIADNATDLIFQEAFPAALAAVFPISRLVVDPERFCDDSKEPMNSVGMGVTIPGEHFGRSFERPQATQRVNGCWISSITRITVNWKR